MLDQAEIDNLIKELESIKPQVRELRGKLNSADRKKEELFREKRKISSDIHSRIKEAITYKEKRNSLTNVVKSTKLSKEDLEQKINTAEAELKELKEQKKKLLEKLGIGDPSELKRSIKHLEFKIETEPMSFDKEKDLMKVLAKMKKQYESTKEVNVLEGKIKSKIRELDETRDRLDMQRKIVQYSAKESQKHHVELIESSKEIDELKKKEIQYEEQIQKIKEEMSVLNDELNQKLEKTDSLRTKLKENNVLLKEDIEKSNHEILKQKDEEVQEKLKRGKKLTTEDLLVLQRTMKG